MPDTPSIAIVGAGATGSYYGARLALAGFNVRFLMRRDREHVRRHGLTLREQDATRRLRPAAVFGRPEEIGAVDIVLITLKTTGNAGLPRLLPPLLGPHTAVVTLQNGLGNEEQLAALLGADRVLGGVCFIGVVRAGPGELVGFRTPGAIQLGEFGRTAGERAQALAGCFERAGVNCRTVDRLAEARWRKLIWNVPFNGLSITAGGLSTDRLLADPALAAEVRALMEEVAAAGRHLGYDIPEAVVQSQIDLTHTMGAYQPSSLVDFLAGREIELEAIWREPLRRAQAAGFPMPRLAKLQARLRTVAQP